MEKNRDFWKLSFESKKRTTEILKFITFGSFTLSTLAIFLGGFSSLFNIEQTQILPAVNKIVEVFAPVFLTSGIAANITERKNKNRISKLNG
jgi:hypothetical protein